MRGSSRLLFVAVALCALAFAAPSALAAKPEVQVLSQGQSAILAKGSLKAKVTLRLKRGRRATVAVKGASATFDDPRFAALTETRRLHFRHSGSKTVSLALRPGARGEVKSCEARTLRVRAGKGRDTAALLRQRADCKPKPIDLSRASECDFIGQQQGSLCMLPFPDDFYTAKDASTNTGRRLAFKSDAMPANASQVHIDPTPYARNDGFSPGQAIVLRVPGLDNPTALTNTNAVPINHLGRYTDRNTPVVVIDTATGKRWPIWVEIDSNAPTPEETALLIHPAKNFTAKHRYVDRPAEPQGLLGPGDRRPGGLPLLPRRPALQGGADQQAAWPLRAGLQEPALGRGGSLQPLPGLGFHRRLRSEDRLADAADPRRRLRPARGHRPRRRRGHRHCALLHGHRRRPQPGFRSRPQGHRHLHGPLLHDLGRRCPLCARQRLQPRRRQAGAERNLDGQLHLHRPEVDRNRSRSFPGAPGRLRARAAGKRRRGQLGRPARPLPGPQDDALRDR